MGFHPFFVKMMVLKPLDILRKGLEVLTNRVKSRKDVLQARLAKKKSISPEDEQWLDYDANLVDEQRILEALENASDYGEGLARLGDEQRNIVKKLHEAAGDLSKVVGKKPKRAYMIHQLYSCS
jgi:hypothetical protein